MPEQFHFTEVKPGAKLRGLTQFRRGARLPKFIGGPADAGAKLGELRVAVIGCGSVGGPVALKLARMGVAALWLVDGKNFKAESLLTHEIGPGDIGKSKAVVTGQRCRAISPATQVHVFAGRVENLPMDAFADVDLVILATDNLAAELEVSRRCRQWAKTMIQAAVHGESLIAQVRILSNAGEEKPCVACGYGQEEWRQLTRQTQFPCDGSGESAPQASEPPTVSVSGLCSLAADLALNQILRLALKLGAPVTDAMLEFCGHTNRAITSPLARNANCPCDHRRFGLLTAPKPLREASLAELAAAAGFRGAVGVATFALEGREWARLGQCQCPVPHSVDRFIPAGQPHAGRCAKCRAAIHVPPFFRHRTVSAWTLGQAMVAALDALGAGPVRCVLADNGHDAVLFRNPTS